MDTSPAVSVGHGRGIAVDASGQRPWIDAGAAVGDRQLEKSAANAEDAHGRRGRIVQPEPEAKAAGASVARRVKDDVVGAGARPDDPRNEAVSPVGGAVRVEIERQRRVAGEMV